ncbi:MAG TPA: helix-turn-helix domain-containing protein [Blastocatellia bacterium]|nr:helix-turn-helix domain-containing protein [Blastocatellia bacterium]
MEMLKPQDAARLMGVSYPTLKQWIYNDKVRSFKTPGGHHRIPRSEVDRITGVRQPISSRLKKPANLPNTPLGTPGFGSITLAGDPRLIQLAVRFNF